MSVGSAVTEFSSMCDERFSEAEMFLVADKSNIMRQQIESACRRVEYICKEATALGLQPFADICSSFIALLREQSQLDPLAASAAKEVFDCLRFYLSIEKMKSEGRKTPEDYIAFTTSSCRELYRRIRNEVDEKDFGLRFLIADDEDVVRTYLEELMLDEGHIVMAVRNGEEAMSALDTGFFELMFTDINMPYASGLDVLRYSKEAGIQTAIVIITGFASVENAAEAIRYGAYDYITKPFTDSDSLLTTVERAREHMNLKRRNQQLMRDLKHKNRELQRYAEGLEDALKNLEEKNRALIHADRMATLGVLVAGLAHEINNPNTFIRGNLQTLEKFWKIIQPPLIEVAGDAKNPKLQFAIEETPTLLHDMMVGTERITKITSGLRSFARADTGSEELAMVNPRTCIEHALNLTGNRIRHGLELEQKLEAMPEIKCNEQQITQVLVNILVNAADAVEGLPSPKVKITSGVTDNGIEIKVYDNGAGVPDDVKEKIFDPFFTTKSVDRGTGLGLSISLGIVRSHGGTLTVQTSPDDGWGSCFTLFLPNQLEKAYGREAPQILIAETRENAYRNLESGLQSMGTFQIDMIRSAKELFDYLRGQVPAVIVLDSDLPDMDTLEVLEQLNGNEAGRKADTIVITDHSGKSFQNCLRKLGAANIFLKPCKLNSLLDCISDLALKKQD